MPCGEDLRENGLNLRIHKNILDFNPVFAQYGESFKPGSGRKHAPKPQSVVTPGGSLATGETDSRGFGRASPKSASNDPLRSRAGLAVIEHVFKQITSHVMESVSVGWKRA